MAGKNSASVLSSVLRNLEAKEEGSTKTASERKIAGKTSSELEAALNDAVTSFTKESSESEVTNDLKKMASAALEKESSFIEAEGNQWGRSIAAGFIEKLAETDGLLDKIDNLDKYATEKDAQFSGRQGYDDGYKAATEIFGTSQTQEKVAYEQGISDGYSHAEQEFLAKVAEEYGEENIEKLASDPEFLRGLQDGFNKAAEGILPISDESDEEESDEGEDEGEDEDEGEGGDEEEAVAEAIAKESYEKLAADQDFRQGVNDGFKYAEEEYVKTSSEKSFEEGFKHAVNHIDKLAQEHGSYEFLAELMA